MTVQCMVLPTAQDNDFTGTAGNDYFFDTRLDEEFHLLGGNDYVELWDGGTYCAPWRRR